MLKYCKPLNFAHWVDERAHLLKPAGRALSSKTLRASSCLPSD
ncbi:hypothetical protein [Paraburkholderia largidicola]|uniref:Uncharacterized protein n=1 Tax=Paraburkholderia largidicola TaxID=3014751 RepID=A0A7I8C2N7_9BURK|nr:hypothetical protein [Paraburkholderia sp. PGU16]BCF95103.1 hypothetical protein PPGU16_81700 [Paraburkholderia sp. PGU16]